MDDRIDRLIRNGKMLDLAEPKLDILRLDLRALSRARVIISGVMSTPITRPVGPTARAARKVLMAA